MVGSDGIESLLIDRFAGSCLGLRFGRLGGGGEGEARLFKK